MKKLDEFRRPESDKSKDGDLLKEWRDNYDSERPSEEGIDFWRTQNEINYSIKSPEPVGKAKDYKLSPPNTHHDSSC